jgi:hypothetical protein
VFQGEKEGKRKKRERLWAFLLLAHFSHANHPQNDIFAQ